MWGVREAGRGELRTVERSQLLQGIYLQRRAKKRSNGGGIGGRRRLLCDGRNGSVILSDGNGSVESKPICWYQKEKRELLG